MKKPSLFFHKNITTKLLITNGLICIAFSIIIIVVFFSSLRVKGVLTAIFDRQAHQIVDNAQMGRDLARVLSDTTLLVSTFYGKKEFLKANGEHLVRKTTDLTAKSTDAKLKNCLSGFTRNIQEVLEQCEAVNLVHRELEAIGQKFDTDMISLGDTISQKIIDLAMQGEDTSLMEHLGYMIPGYKETLLRINMRLADLGLGYFESLPPEKEHPVLTLLDAFDRELRTLGASEQDIANYGRQFADHIQVYEATILKFHQVAGELRAHLDEMEGKKEGLLLMMEETDRHIEKTIEDAGTALKKQITEAMMASMFIFLGTLPVIMFAFFISQSVGKSLKRVIMGLQNAFEQLAEVSDQVLAASQHLSERASDQAASLEETSSCLEEVASATRQNTENASHADHIVTDSAGNIEEANNSMTRLTRFIEDISEASEETRKIVKTIDEIAFQTNLLALNAAVEAARAGQAGAGFAVVANEVRNLAMRSAESAKNTAVIIEATVKKVRDGLELISEANEIFNRVQGDSCKVSSLVSEIARASNEQDRGIDQVNRTVGKMENVVQRNAANAEELAANAEEMNVQTGYMDRVVQELAALVGMIGKKSHGKEVRPRAIISELQ